MYHPSFCSVLLKISNFWGLLHMPMLGCWKTDLILQGYVVHVPYIISSLVQMIVLSLPFYPWIFAWHSHANVFGLSPLVFTSCVGPFSLLILFCHSSPYNIRNVPTLKYVFIKSRLRMTFENWKVLWIKFALFIIGHID